MSGLLVYFIYLILLALMIRSRRTMKFFSDEHFSKKQLALLFILKALAVPVFYFLYVKMYGGIDEFDAGKFYHDAVVVNQVAYDHPGEYLKLLIGVQDEEKGSFLYGAVIEPTYNWENGKFRDFFYNDNRIVIRIHSVLHFIAFNSYFVHALFSCFLSFTGLFFLYRALKEFFIAKEKYLFLVFCFFPALWLYTGALLKEGLSVFFLGCIVLQLRNTIGRKSSKTGNLPLPLLIFVSLLLKTYLLFFALVFFAVFFSIHFYYRRKGKLAILLSAMLILLVGMNFTALGLRGKNLATIALERQREFADLAKGGIFLLDSEKFVRLPYDYKLVKSVPDRQNYFTIRKNISFTYWEHSHQQDTLFNPLNEDTLTQYSLVYDLPSAGSNIVIDNSGSIWLMCLNGLFYATAHPLFFNATGWMQIFVSAENLVLLSSVLLVLIWIVIRKRDLFVPVSLMIFGLSLFVIIGFTTPNTGAIHRYRSPAAIFIVASGLYASGLINKRNTIQP